MARRARWPPRTAGPTGWSTRMTLRAGWSASRSSQVSNWRTKRRQRPSSGALRTRPMTPHLAPLFDQSAIIHIPSPDVRIFRNPPMKATLVRLSVVVVPLLFAGVLLAQDKPVKPPPEEKDKTEKPDKKTPPDEDKPGKTVKPPPKDDEGPP